MSRKRRDNQKYVHGNIVVVARSANDTYSDYEDRNEFFQTSMSSKVFFLKKYLLPLLYDFA